MRFEIDGKKYTVKERWRDVTIREMDAAFAVLHNQPKVIHKLIMSDSDNAPEVDQDTLTRFYIDWIGCFSDIPREVLQGKIVIDEPGTVSLYYLASLCLKFLGEPQKVEHVNRFRFKGKRYRIIPSFTTLTGVNRLLNGATYGDWCDLNALMNAFDGLNKGKYKAMAQVSAVLFSDKPSDKRRETIDTRSRDFMDLDLQTAYAGYFFLERHINKLQRFLKTSSKAEILRVMGSEGLISKYQGSFIGRLKLYFLRKLGFLRRWDESESAGSNGKK